MAPFHFGGQWRVCDVESPKQDGPVVLLAHPIWLSASGTQCVESMAWRVSSEESIIRALQVCFLLAKNSISWRFSRIGRMDSLAWLGLAGEMACR